MEAITELLQFLDLSARIEVKAVALDHLLGLTGASEGAELLSNVPELFPSLLKLASDDKSELIRKNASLALINLSANKKMLEHDAEKVVGKLWQMVENGSDPACMILSNLTIDKVGADIVHDNLKKCGISIETIVDTICKDTSNSDSKLHYLGPFMSNLSQLNQVREDLLSKSCLLLSRLLPFTEFQKSSVRRGGVVGAIRNCCFDTSIHLMLLQKLDILTRLLLPLAGPTPEDVDDAEIDKLPIDLQYLDEDKKIEDDPDIRRLLLEALLQLCATRQCREIIRNQNAYYVLRELHKNEADESVKLACENVVDILIKKEEEIKLDNYKDVDVPEDVVKKFEEELWKFIFQNKYFYIDVTF